MIVHDIRRSVVQDDLKLLGDGRGIPKSQGRGWWFESRLWNLLSTWRKTCQVVNCLLCLALAYRPSVSKKNIRRSVDHVVRAICYDIIFIVWVSNGDKTWHPYLRWSAMIVEWCVARRVLPLNLKNEHQEEEAWGTWHLGLHFIVDEGAALD